MNFSNVFPSPKRTKWICTCQVVILTALILIPNILKSQLNYKLAQADRIAFSFIESPDMVLPFQAEGQDVGLGFSLTNYGVTTDRVTIYNGYIVIPYQSNFEREYNKITLSPSFLYDFSLTWQYKPDAWYIRRFVDNGIHKIRLELRYVAAESFPNEYMSFAFEISEDYTILLHMGPNSLSEAHPTNGSAALAFFELDGERNATQTDSTYYNTVLQVYGDPLNPLADYNLNPPGPLYFTNYPYDGCRFIFKPEALTSIRDGGALSMQLRVSPVPARDIARIEFLRPLSGQLQLTDSQGRLLASWSLSGESTWELPTKSFAEGNYFLRFEGKEGDRFVEKLIIAR